MGLLRQVKARVRWECYRITRRRGRLVRRLHGGKAPDWKHDFKRRRRALESLREHLLRFWYPQVLDKENGGYRLHHDMGGRWKGPANKNLVGQARTALFFSYLARSKYGNEQHLQAARHGYQFLMAALNDSQHGGFYWEVDWTGKVVTKSGKHLYGQAFALYALSEYAMASKDMAAAEAARQLFDVMERNAHDAKYGGYREFFQRDWSAVPEGEPGYLSAIPNTKFLNTHLHLLEALTTYFALTKHFSLSGEALARERLIELIMIQSNAVVRKRDGACTDRHQRDWTPRRGRRDDRVNYGHDLENIWLLIEACRAAGIPHAPLMDLFRTLFEQTFRYGFDHRWGGFLAAGYLGTRADSRDKIWWIQAEGMICALHMYLQTRKAFYWDSFARTLDWIMQYQLDEGCGEWHERVEPNGNPSGDKAGHWKTSYHTGRAILSCLEMLTVLEGEYAASGEWRQGDSNP